MARGKRLGPPVLWCVQNKDGELLPGTLSSAKGEALDSLFDDMDIEFQKKYWHNAPASRRAYGKFGYKAIRVMITPVT